MTADGTYKKAVGNAARYVASAFDTGSLRDSRILIAGASGMLRPAVGVNADRIVQEHKCKTPAITETDRAEIIITWKNRSVS